MTSPIDYSRYICELWDMRKSVFLASLGMREHKLPYVALGPSLKLWIANKNISRLMKKPTVYICENKDADQLRGNREADQRLCFHFTDCTFPLLLKSEISSF